MPDQLHYESQVRSTQTDQYEMIHYTDDSHTGYTFSAEIEHVVGQNEIVYIQLGDATKTLGVSLDDLEFFHRFLGSALESIRTKNEAHE
jgi:hypothetical protein